MTERLERALAAVRRRPPREQDTIADVMLGMVEIAEPLEVEAEHLAAVLEGLAQAERGEFVDGDASDMVRRAFARAREPR